MKKNKYGLSILLSVILGLIVSGWVVYKSASPLKDGLYLRYETTLLGVQENNIAIHEIRFRKKNKKYYQVKVQSSGFLDNEQTYTIDRYFNNENNMLLPGPTAAVLWIEPYLLWIGNNIAAGEVINHSNWKGYSVAVVQDPALNNCYGFYDRKTGLQVGYMNCFTSQKILTILKEKNIQIL